MMAENYIKKIRTNEGDKQIDYEALANLPVGSESVKIVEQDLVLAEGKTSCSVPVERVNHGDVLHVEVYVDGKMWSTDVTAEAIGDSFSWEGANLGGCPWSITYSTHANVMAFISYTASKYKKSSVIIYNTAIKRFDDNYIPSTIARVADVDKKIEDNRLAYEEKMLVGSAITIGYDWVNLELDTSVQIGNRLLLEFTNNGVTTYDEIEELGLGYDSDIQAYVTKEGRLYVLDSSGETIVLSSMQTRQDTETETMVKVYRTVVVVTIDDKFIPDSIARIADMDELKIKPIANGSMHTLSDSAEAPLQGIRIFGKTKQATTTGKNKLPYPYEETSKSNRYDVSITVNDDGSLLLNGTSTASQVMNFYFHFHNKITLPAGNYICGGVASSTCYISVYDPTLSKYVNTNNKETISLNLTEESQISILVQWAANAILNNVLVKPFIVEADKYDGNWEPYTGGIPSPNPSYPQALESVGDDGSVEQFVKGGNLFNNDASLLKPVTYISSSSGTEQTRIGYDWFTLPVGVYTLSAKILDTTVTNFYIYGVKYNADGTNTILNTIIGDIEQPPITFTVAEGDKILIYNGHNNLDYTIAAKFFNAVQIQLNPGTVATPYEPYKSQSLIIPTPNVCIGESSETYALGTDTGEVYTNEGITLVEGEHLLFEITINGETVYDEIERLGEQQDGECYFKSGRPYGWETNRIYFYALRNDATEISVKMYRAISNRTNGLPGIPVSSGGNYTDESGQQWICDEIDLERGVYVQRVGEHRNTGEGEQGGTSATESEANPNYYWNIRIVGLKAGSRLRCNCFRDTGSKASSIPYNCWSYATIPDYAYFTAPKEVIDSYEGSTIRDRINAWTADTFSEDNPLIVKYRLAEPIETPLSEEEIEAYKALHTNYPNTTIYNDDGAYTEVKYVADTKNYVDNKIATEVAKLTAAIITE